MTSVGIAEADEGVPHSALEESDSDPSQRILNQSSVLQRHGFPDSTLLLIANAEASWIERL